MSYMKNVILNLVDMANLAQVRGDIEIQIVLKSEDDKQRVMNRLGSEFGKDFFDVAAGRVPSSFSCHGIAVKVLA